jgi:cellulose biosynthesis protein BcsQ
MVSTKGGVGKTTVTVQTAYAVANDGVKVAVCDLDPRKDTTDWLTQHPIEGVVFQNHPTDPLPDDIAFRLIDTEGSLGVIETLKTLPQANLYIIPTTPDALDVRGATLTIEKLRKAFPTAKMLLLWNCIQKRLSDSDPEVLSQWAKELGIPVMPVNVGKFSCNARARLAGWKVIQNAKAEPREQWHAVSSQIMSNLLGGKA